MKLHVTETAVWLATAGMLLTSPAWVGAQRPGGAVAIDADDIGGTVSGPKGPEAGVWVIAETTDLPTKFARIVATDDQGRYVVPDLPAASYQLFVRGYGLVDSARVTAKPGQRLDLKAVPAPTPKAAAEIYPANYWLALFEEPEGNRNVRHCGTACHQVGDKATRDFPKELPTFPTSVDAWDHRVRVGPVGGMMAAGFMQLGEHRKRYAQWTDAIKAGALPKEVPPRPVGIERNMVVTLWDWATPVSFLHDESAAAHYDPTLNANQPVWGVSNSNDFLAWMDPVKNESGLMPVPTGTATSGMKILEPSPYWGKEEIWQPKGQPRSAGLDAKGRVWFASAFRGQLTGFGGGGSKGGTQPKFCLESSSNKYANYFPMPTPSGKQVGVYDPKSKKFSVIDTCFTTDHNHLEPNGRLVFGQNDVVGWIDIPAWETTQNDEAAQAWLPAVLDTNGDGRITKPWTEPDAPIDPTKDHRVKFGCYQPAVSPLDGSIWCSGTTITRIDPGPNPPETARAEQYTSPVKGGHGVDIDKNGVVWQGYNGRGPGSENAVATSFDRRKCKVTNGPKATGDHCPEGWTVHRKRDQKADESDHYYLTYMDREDVLGIGVKNVPYFGGANSDSLIGLHPSTGKFFTIRVPYPMGYFPRSMQPRIDNPKTGWKGRGLWTNYASYTPWHVEGGRGTRPKVVKIQMRSTPTDK